MIGLYKKLYYEIKVLWLISQRERDLSNKIGNYGSIVCLALLGAFPFVVLAISAWRLAT